MFENHRQLIEAVQQDALLPELRNDALGENLQAAREREDAIRKAIVKLFKKHGVKLDEHLLHIDSLGEINVHSKGGAQYAKGYGTEKPKVWPKKLVSMLAKAGLTQRPGMNPSKLDLDIKKTWVRANHFTWEKVLKNLGYL